MKAQIQIQEPGGSFKKPSITLTRGGDTVWIPISVKKMKELMVAFPKIPREG